MVNFDDVTKGNIKEHNPYLIAGGSGSVKTNP